MKVNQNDINLWKAYQSDWNRFAKEALGVSLDPEQQEMLMGIQENRRVSARSGHARGKDYVAAVASLCFLYLFFPSKVINTAPTGRQVTSIMMSEISKIHKDAKIPLPGKVLVNEIKFDDHKDWFLIGFKAEDKDIESWAGFHSQNIMIVVTEASGIEQQTFDAIEGLMTGNSKLVLVFNPNEQQGEAYRSTRSPYYKKFKLSCLDAPNVKEKKTIYPGQVDYDWVKERVERWCEKISKEEYSSECYDFEFEGNYYRPNDLFKIKVLGEFASEDENQVIPLRWIELSNERWKLMQKPMEPLMLGVDVAGMGNDETVFTYRYGNYVEKIVPQRFPVSNPANIHMAIVGKIKNEIKEKGGKAYIDTIGEGAGVYSRLVEQNVESVSVKFSESAKRFTDMTGERTFANMRAFCYWAVRDALDPKLEGELALPPDDNLAEELTEIKVKALRSDGSILLEPKEDIKKRLNRSTDSSDSLAVTYYPKSKFEIVVRTSSR